MKKTALILGIIAVLVVVVVWMVWSLNDCYNWLNRSNLMPYKISIWKEECKGYKVLEPSTIYSRDI